MAATSTRPRRQHRRPKPPAELLDLYASSRLIGYAPESFRKMRPGKPGWVHTAPPFIKRYGRCMIWRADLIAWAKSHDLPLPGDVAA